MCAIATFIAVVIAYIGLSRERMARRDDEAARNAELRRQQAERVCGWYGGWRGEGTNKIVIQNDSGLPVYNVVISLVLVQGAGPKTGEEVASLERSQKSIAPNENASGCDQLRTEVFLVPPGRWEVELVAHGAGMSARPGIEIAYRDAKGSSWIRRANGILVEIHRDPFEYLYVSLPITGGQLLPVNGD